VKAPLRTSAVTSKATLGFLLGAGFLSLAQGCGSPAPIDGQQGTGGSVLPSGGITGAGGSASGGALGVGGTAPAGGAPGVGGGSGGTSPSTGGVSSGGDVGTGGETASGGSSGVAPCSDADLLCLDFESDTVGMKPSGDPWEASACSDQTYQASVTAGSGNNGSQGYVTGNASSGTNYCALMTDIGSPPEFWVRAWIKIGGPNPDAQHEVTFFELGPVTGDDPELRIGYRGDSSCPDNGGTHQGFELGATQGPGGEYTGCTGYKPVSDEWYCLEVHVDQTAGSSLVADLYVDSVQQDYLVHSMPETEVLGNFAVSYLKVGMQSYSGTFEELVIDDLSLSTTQLGCPAK